MSTLSPTDVLTALRLCEVELVRTIGGDWPKLERQYRELVFRLESSTGPTQMLAAAEIVELFAPYDSARERLNNAIAAQTEVGELLFALADIADQLDLNQSVAAQFKQAAQTGNQQRFIWMSSPVKATSLKVENVIVNFEFGASAEFLIGLITTATKDVLGEANVILKAAGVLLMINSLYRATAVKLDEREATVFCGFARAHRKPDGGVKEEVILANTNAVRHTVSLKPIDREELGNVLYKLAGIKSVERVPGQTDTWRIIESHNVPRK